MSLNRVIIQGRLVADPDIRTTSGGISVANLRVAVERNYKDSDGKKEVDFFQCTAWRGTADFVQKFFHKGELILIDGKLQNSTYTDKDGNNRVSTQVVVDSVFFCGPSGNGRGGNGHSEQQNRYEANTAPTNNFKDIEDGEVEGELPF